jgi:hypothetical protein
MRTIVKNAEGNVVFEGDDVSNIEFVEAAKPVAEPKVDHPEHPIVDEPDRPIMGRPGRPKPTPHGGD